MKIQEFYPEGIAPSIDPDASMEELMKTLFYRSSITGPDGAHFELLREKRHTGEDVQRAKDWLRQNRDVVSISVIHETNGKS